VRVYRIPFSTNVERVALALAFKGLSVEWVDVDPADRSPVRRASGQDLVPVLEGDDGTVLHDSTRILRALEERYPEPALFPRDPARRAEVETFLDWFDRVWKGPPNAIEAEERAAAPDQARLAALGAEMTASLDRFEALLDERHHLMGNAFGVADCSAFPFLKYGLLHDPADDERFHGILREHLPLAGRERLVAWIRRVDERPRA
jgi:glutathione S-transferase